MNNKLVVIGAGGHSKVCREIAELNGYKSVIILDDNSNDDIVFGKTDLFTEFIEDSDFFVAIGNNKIRKTFIENIVEKNGKIITLIHPKAVVSKYASVGYGVVVMAGAIINPETIIGNGVIVNTCSSIDHDCNIEDFCHISVGSHIAGTVHIGAETFVGAGVVVINNICICENTIIGAGATVVSNIGEQGTYVGVPAKRI